MRISKAISLLVTVVDVALETGEYGCVRLLSGPGIGKSSAVREAARILSKKHGKKCGVKLVRLCEVEQPDVKGFGMADIPNRKMVFTDPYWAIDPEKDGEFGFVFFDEQPQSADDVNKVWAEIADQRRVGEYNIPDGWVVVSAGNREGDRSGVRKTMAFIQNRIVDIFVDGHKDDLVDWQEKNNIHHTIISYTEAFPGEVLADRVPDKPGPFCTPRSLCRLSPFIDRMSIEMFTEYAAGAIGEGAAAKFVAHLRVHDELPTYAQIVKAPKTTKVPERPDAVYATVRMVAHNVDKDTAVQAFEYLGRLPPEFQATALRHAVRRTPQIVQHPEFATWLRSNKKLLEAANLLDKK
jgi:hypothetical protein